MANFSDIDLEDRVELLQNAYKSYKSPKSSSLGIRYDGDISSSVPLPSDDAGDWIVDYTFIGYGVYCLATNLIFVKSLEPFLSSLFINREDVWIGLAGAVCYIFAGCFYMLAWHFYSKHDESTNPLLRIGASRSFEAYFGWNFFANILFTCCGMGLLIGSFIEITQCCSLGKTICATLTNILFMIDAALYYCGFIDGEGSRAPRPSESGTDKVHVLHSTLDLYAIGTILFVVASALHVLSSILMLTDYHLMEPYFRLTGALVNAGSGPIFLCSALQVRDETEEERSYASPARSILTLGTKIS